VAALERDARHYDLPDRGERFGRLRALGRRGLPLRAADPDIAQLREKNA
jgi:hypothetical protein